MHELSVLKKVVDKCSEVAKENNATKVKIVTLEIGELTGYIPKFFTEYFPIITKDNPLYSDTKVKLISTPGEALCEKCGAMYNVMKHKGECPLCKSRNKKIIGGHEFSIKEILVE